MARPAKVDIDIYMGDDYTFVLTLSSAGVPINLTGRTYQAQVRETPGALNALFAFTVDLTAAASGQVALSVAHGTLDGIVTPKMLGGLSEQVCFWDVKQTAGGSVTTVLEGTATLIRNKTR